MRTARYVFVFYSLAGAKGEADQNKIGARETSQTGSSFFLSFFLSFFFFFFFFFCPFCVAFARADSCEDQYSPGVAWRCHHDSRVP